MIECKEGFLKDGVCRLSDLKCSDFPRCGLKKGNDPEMVIIKTDGIKITVKYGIGNCGWSRSIDKD